MSHQRPAPPVEGTDYSTDTGYAPGEPTPAADLAADERPVVTPRAGTGWGTAFLGWLAANGLMVLLIALVAASGTALTLTRADSTTLTSDAATIGVTGAVALLVVVTLSYLVGGYVAGRMSEVRGALHGFGVWLIGAVVTLVLALVGLFYGSRYDVLTPLNLPRVPLDQGTITQFAGIVLVVVAVASLIAAVAGGWLGGRRHRRNHGW